MSSYDANNDPIWNDAPVAKNGVKFRLLDDFPEGHPVRQIEQKNNASKVIGENRYVYREHEGGALVFRNPIKWSNNINANTRPSNTSTQTQLEGIITKLGEITTILRRIELHGLSKSKADATNTTNTTNTATNDTTGPP